MMKKIPQISKAAGQLINQVGAGLMLSDGETHLRIAYCQREKAPGLLLQTHLNDAAATFWLDEAQWCQWVAPMLVVPSWQRVPEEFRHLLMLWTLEDAGRVRGSNNLPWPASASLESGEREAGLYWHLAITCEERQLDLYLPLENTAWVAQLADYAFPVSAGEQQTVKIPVQASLLAGWLRTNCATLNKAQPGDALRLQKHWPVQNGTLCLYLDRPLAVVRQDDHEDNYFYVEEVMEDFEDWMEVEPEIDDESEINDEYEVDEESEIEPVSAPSLSPETLVANAAITVTVEVAQIATTIQALGTLAPGAMLQGTATHDGAVTLKVAGRAFARGDLLDIDGALAVRITALC
ncbi:type III secretion system cytoplasmic ring protein SctQ [Pantoea cypripedii]|uniref:YscQ/HrcQ family type III secretion apparatus protein n=1 Tax=Pantoea cypripedii TaxID=55209 RepID=A0A6B9GEZ3_PANCY|nr:type III secretion system cytoplasmic ring protein SctQ [Pantoea cypripedii]QGY32159.1 YscQ/HrcQ family type III secretion apparatus protein [Pantoea cypripedii]